MQICLQFCLQIGMLVRKKVRANLAKQGKLAILRIPIRCRKNDA
jgi:hypothetical protein